jgi:hypothetical protein
VAARDAARQEVAEVMADYLDLGAKLADALRERDEARAELARRDRLGQEYDPKCEHGVAYGGIGIGCCPRCDNKALILASNPEPTTKA